MKSTPIPITGMIEFDASGDEPTFDVDVNKLAERLDGGEVEAGYAPAFSLEVADRRIDELEAQLAEAKQQNIVVNAQLANAETRADTCAKSALEVLSSCFCDAHAKKVKRLSFPAFHDWTTEMGCHACAFERAEIAEARLKEAEHEREIERSFKDQFAGLAEKLQQTLDAVLEKKTAAEARADAAEKRVSEWCEAALRHYPPNWAFDATNPEMSIANIVQYRAAFGIGNKAALRPAIPGESEGKE